MKADCNQNFRPVSGTRNRHLQTLLPVILNSFRRPSYKRQEFILADGDFVDLDWTDIPDKSTCKPIVLMFHGLEGSSESHYARAMMEGVRQQGWYGVVMNFRSCSGRINRNPRLYHSGETSDALEVIQWLKISHPDAPLFAVGYSLGGNMLLKLAGEQGGQLPFEALAAVSVPVQLAQATQFMQQGLSRFYETYMLNALKRKMVAKYERHDYAQLFGLHLRDLKACRHIRDFDNLFTARIHGFEDADDYYRRSSAYTYLASIEKPCLLLHADDDPLAPVSSFPKRAEMNESVMLEMTAFGGHAGYLVGSFRHPQHWPVKRIMNYFTEINE